MMVFATAHQSFAFLIIMAQIFGAFPLNGVSRNSYKFLRFRWRSLKLLYTVLFLGADCFESCCHIYNMIVLPISMIEFGKFGAKMKWRESVRFLVIFQLMLFLSLQEP